MKYKQSKMIFTSVVAAILILSPLAPVFAQETTTPDTGASAPAANLEAPAATMGPADTNNTDIDPNDPKIDADDSTDNTGVEAAKTADNPASVDSSVSPNSLTIGTPPENENKKLADVTLPNTDKANGTFSYKYPITVPPGRNGLQPSVNLAYSSQEKKDGIVGVAWSVDTPYIERVNKQGLERLYTDNNFRSSMDGELVGIDSTNYGPKVENGSFSKYSFSSNTWTVTDKNGTVYTFGSQAATRLDDPSDSSRVYRWMLEEVRDTNDNFITYEYYKDAGQIYPSKITYTGNGTTAGIFTVNFDRTSRAHSFTSYATGFAVTTNYLISQIRTEVSSVWARKYNLAYTTADNGVSVLLDTITESGQDDDNQVTTLPPTNFDYKVSDPGWTYDEGTYLQPPHAEGHGIDDFGGRFADINGDGLVDYICHNNATLVAACTRNSPEIYINNGTRFVSGSGWHFPLVAGIGPETEYFLDINMSDSGLRIVDVNGDGLPDLVKGLKQHGEPDIEYVYINNGVDGWDYSSTWTLPVPVIDNGNDKGTRFADINGDGLVDILCHNLSVSGDWNCSQTNPKIYLNTGSGWAETTAWKLPITGDSGTIREAFADGDHEDTGTRIIDLNGDGLPDLVNTRGSTRNVYWNNGRSGWDYDTTTTLVPPYSYELGPHDIGERSMDVNNDGLPDDLCHNDSAHGDCRSDNPQIHINTGVTYAPSSWRFPQIKDTEIVSEYFTDSNYDDAGLRILDMDGDGLPDLYNQYDSDTPLYFNNNVIDSNLLTKITYPEGGSTEISYKATGKLQDSSGNVLNPNLPIVFDVVSEITNDDGLGNTYSKSYSYTGGKYYFGDYLDRKFAGFKTVTETDGAGNVTVTYYHQGDDSDSAHGEYDDDIAKAGKPYRIEVYDDAGNLYSATINKWDEYNLGTGRDFVKLAQTVTAAYDGDSTHKDTAVAYTYDNANGNLTQKIEYGEVAGSDDGTFTDTGTDDFTTVYSYATDGADLVGLPDDVIVTDHDFATVKEDRYYYDGQSLGTATVGNQTQHDMWTDGTNYVHTQKAYDGTYGLTIVDTDERGKTTGYSYDSYNLYPVAVTNALAQTTDYTYDYSSGQAEQTTDPNSLVTLSVYDGLDRLLEQQQPDLAAHASLVAKATYIYTDTAGAVSVHQTDNLDAATARETYQYFDGLGRLIQERKEAEGTNYEVTDKAYNNLGLPEKESLPDFSAGSSKTCTASGSRPGSSRRTCATPIRSGTAGPMTESSWTPPARARG